MEKYKSRKFLLACFFAISGLGCLVGGLLDGGEFVAISSLVLGLYGAADVADKRLND